MKKGLINKQREPFSVRDKMFWEVQQARSLLGEKFRKSLCHEPDGLIFQPSLDVIFRLNRVNDTRSRAPIIIILYACYFTAIYSGPISECSQMETAKYEFRRLQAENCQRIWHGVNWSNKWFVEDQKFIGELFLLTYSIVPQKIGLLFVGQLESPFSKIRVTKDIRNLDGKIIECKFEGNQWTFMRERTDKSYPNSYNTAMCESSHLWLDMEFWSDDEFFIDLAVCGSIQHPVTEEILFDTTEHMRFADDSMMMPPPRGFVKH